MTGGLFLARPASPLLCVSRPPFFSPLRDFHAKPALKATSSYWFSVKSMRLFIRELPKLSIRRIRWAYLHGLFLAY